MASAPSADYIKPVFTFRRFDKVVGEPTYTLLYKVETQATINVATVLMRLNPPHIKYAGIVK